MLGFTTDGYLATADSSFLSTDRIQLWDLTRGVVSGDIHLDDSSRLHSYPDLVDAVGLEGNNRPPASLPLVAQRWSDELCRAGLPDFTPVERTAFVPGSPNLPTPCS